jgi:hypothetical protein
MKIIIYDLEIIFFFKKPISPTIKLADQCYKKFSSSLTMKQNKLECLFLKRFLVQFGIRFAGKDRSLTVLCGKGATTLSITTFSIMTLSMKG